jgi:cytochrome c oxidase subunit 3
VVFFLRIPNQKDVFVSYKIGPRLQNTLSRVTVYQGLVLTIVLGFLFTLIQLYEYFQADFSIADGIFGSTFFLMTGFHGLHVIIGTVFLIVALIRHYYHHFTAQHHIGFEAAAWYWHFVDVVWLFLYISVYCWGS